MTQYEVKDLKKGEYYFDPTSKSIVLVTSVVFRENVDAGEAGKISYWIATALYFHDGIHRQINPFDYQLIDLKSRTEIL